MTKTPGASAVLIYCFTLCSVQSKHPHGFTCSRQTTCRVQGRMFLLLISTDSVRFSLDNHQLDAHLLYFTIRPLHSSTCFKH